MTQNATRHPSLLTRFQARVAALRRRLRLTETTWLFLLSALAGVAAGLGSIAFHHLIGIVQWVSFGTTDHAGPFSVIAREGYPTWRVLVAPPIGGLIVGVLVWRFARDAKGHGVPAVVRAVHQRGGSIDPIVAFVKMVASATTLGTGGSLGREGPVIQIGAALGSGVGQLLGATPRQLKMLVAGGAAAGLAAIFNAPLGGAFFALEVIVGSFAMESFGPVVVASVAATVVSRTILGDHAVIEVPRYGLQHAWELLLYAGLGVSCGGGAVLLTRGVAAGAAAFERVPVPEWFKPVFGGMVCALGAIFITPRILGNGYETVAVLLGNWSVEVSLLILLAAKLVATCATLGSGGSGGVFGPSLFLGAILGAVAGRFGGWISGGAAAPQGAYVLVGMAAFVGGATHAPVSLVLMLFEMSNDYNIVLPLLVATSIASIVAKSIYAESIDTVLDAREGVRVHKNVEQMALHAVRVEEAARPASEATVARSARLAEILDRFGTARTSTLAVVEPDGRYVGVIALATLQRSKASIEAAAATVVAEDLSSRDVRRLDPAAPLTDAVEAFHGTDLDDLPVVTLEGQFAGFLSEGDIVAAYRRWILKADIVSTIDVAPPDRAHGERIELPAGIGTAEVDVPAWLVGRTLADLDVRRRFGVLVLAILATDGARRLPDPGSAFAAGERLVVLGPESAIESIRAGEEPKLASQELVRAVTHASERIDRRQILP